MALPDDITAFDLKEALLHPSIGYRLVGSKEHAWYLSRGDVPLQIQKLSGPLRPSYVTDRLFEAGVSERELISALAATTASSAPAPPPAPPPPASPPTTS